MVPSDQGKDITPGDMQMWLLYTAAQVKYFVLILRILVLWIAYIPGNWYSHPGKVPLVLLLKMYNMWLGMCRRATETKEAAAGGGESPGRG